MGCLPSKLGEKDVSTTNGSHPNHLAATQVAAKPKMKTGFDQVYQLGEQLGSGSFSVVKEATRKASGESFAVKCVSIASNTLDEEIIILRQLQTHPHVIEMYEVYQEGRFVYIVTEKMTGGELFDYMAQTTQQYTEWEARETCQILLQAVSYLHSKQIAHRDLKPENILRSRDGQVKIADFGLAKKCVRPASLTTQCGTPRYVAPEILEFLPYDTQVDMWSVGVLCFILVGGYPPFSEANQRDLFLKIRKGRYEFHPDSWGHVSEESKSFLSSCLMVDPSQRITAQRGLQTIWITREKEILEKRPLTSNLEAFRTFNAQRRFKGRGVTNDAKRPATPDVKADFPR